MSDTRRNAYSAHNYAGGKSTATPIECDFVSVTLKNGEVVQMRYDAELDVVDVRTTEGSLIVRPRVSNSVHIDVEPFA